MKTQRRQRIRPDSGMTILELLVTLVILLMAVGGALGSISSFVVLGDSAHESTQAYRAAQAQLEEMRTVEFREVFARYNSTNLDDPGGVSPGDGFTVDGLQLRSDDADVFHGEILFPSDGVDPTILREDVVDQSFGLPRDLDGDDATDAGDRSGDYQILPVVVRVQWRGKAGNRLVEIATILRQGVAQ